MAVFSILNDNELSQKPIAVFINNDRGVNVAYGAYYYYEPSSSLVQTSSDQTGHVSVMIQGTRVTSGSGGSTVPIDVPLDGSQNYTIGTGNNHILAVRCGDGTEDVTEEK